MATSLAAIRDALETRLATVSGLHVYDVWPDQLDPPAAVIRPTIVDAEQCAGSSGIVLYVFEVHIFTSLAPGLPAAQDALDALITARGTGSIEAALLGDTTLGGIGRLIPLPWRGYSSVKIPENGPEYLRAIKDCEVWAA